MVLLWCCYGGCYGVSRWLLCGCYGVAMVFARWLLSVSMLLLWHC